MVLGFSCPRNVSYLKILNMVFLLKGLFQGLILGEGLLFLRVGGRGGQGGGGVNTGALGFFILTLAGLDSNREKLG